MKNEHGRQSTAPSLPSFGSNRIDSRSCHVGGSELIRASSRPAEAQISCKPPSGVGKWGCSVRQPTRKMVDAMIAINQSAIDGCRPIKMGRDHRLRRHPAPSLSALRPHSRVLVDESTEDTLTPKPIPLALCGGLR